MWYIAILLKKLAKNVFFLMTSLNQRFYFLYTVNHFLWLYNKLTLVGVELMKIPYLIYKLFVENYL